MDEPCEILKTASQWLAAGFGICMATIIRREGSAPREIGAKMVMASDGRVAGSVGGGGTESKILELMRQAMKANRPAVVDFVLSEDSKDLDAMCGGNISVFIEPMGEARRLFVIGAGHIGVALAELARRSGFAVTLVDDRQQYLTESGLTETVERQCVTPDDYRMLGIDESSFVVICTRGHRLDKDWLERIITLKPRYLGMLGSKHKARSIFKILGEGGVASEVLESVRTPVGLDIGALTPPEIAVSIVAELISEWRKAGGEAA